MGQLAKSPPTKDDKEPVDFIPYEEHNSQDDFDPRGYGGEELDISQEHPQKLSKIKVLSVN